MMMNHLTSIYMIHNFMSGDVALIPGLCCLTFLVACNTQLGRVVMCFEIRWIEGKHAHGSARP